jgi:hypothetical protein
LISLQVHKKISRMQSYNSLSEALADLKRRGYVEDFNLSSDCLECSARKLQWHPERFSVDEFYRFEGMSNPDDNSIVFAISSDDGIKGTLVDAYGMYAENLSEPMIRKLAIKR